MNSKDKIIPTLEYDERLKLYILPSLSPLVKNPVQNYVPVHDRVVVPSERFLKLASPIQSYNFTEVAKSLLTLGVGIFGLSIAPIPTLFLAAMWQIPNINKKKVSDEPKQEAQIVIPRETVKPHERRIERETVNVHIQYEKEVYLEK
jgi:hypothetical protein